MSQLGVHPLRHSRHGRVPGFRSRGIPDGIVVVAEAAAVVARAVAADDEGEGAVAEPEEAGEGGEAEGPGQVVGVHFSGHDQHHHHGA